MNAPGIALATWAGLLLAVAGFAGYTWAVAALFRRPRNGLPTEMRWLGALGTVFFALHVLALRDPAPGLPQEVRLAGLALYAVALGLFWWAVPYAQRYRLRVAFSDGGAGTLIQQGPWRLVRHPFYTSYTLYWIAGVLASGQLALLATVAVMVWFYARAIRREEAEYLAGPLAERYRAYRARTGACFPKVLRRAA